MTSNFPQGPGQIDPRNTVVINGSGVLNLFGNSVLGFDPNNMSDPINLRYDNTQNNVFTNTLASLVFNDDGGSASVPTVNTGTGTFVANGATLTAPGVLILNGDGSGNAITSNPTSVGSIALVSGRLAFGGSLGTIVVKPDMFNGNNVAPLQAGLNITGIIDNPTVGSTPANILVTGGGVLGLAAQDVFTGSMSVASGTTVYLRCDQRRQPLLPP